MRHILTRFRPAPITRRALGRLLVAGALATLLLVRGREATMGCVSAFAPQALAGTVAAASMPMVDWFATHSPVGVNSTQAAYDSFTVSNFIFDRDGNSSTQVDTARIVQGDAIVWKWVTGTHTVTNGTGTSDPGAGSLFDQPMSTSFRRFTFQFDNVGTFPFFCRPHAGLNMRGVVVVSQDLTSVGPAAVAGGEGFVRSPWPNPSGGLSTFRFALSRPGHVRITVLDAQGRRVATPLERDLGAGTYDSHWSGRTPEGETAPAGVYFVRIELPGLAQTRRISRIR